MVCCAQGIRVAEDPLEPLEALERQGGFVRMMDGPAYEAATPRTVIIGATYHKAHRTATSLRSKKGGQVTKGAVCLVAQRAA